MASTVLPNGIIIPEKFSRDWYADLYHNWQELDNLLGGGTPKDGTLTIQKNGATVGTFSANQATNETIDITVPDVNDGTLTIQQNGTTVDTFTANSSTDKTVDITVPTKTSDLTNDSGFITEDTTKIPLAGSNQISGSLIPSTDGTVNLGGTSYQWNNAYIKSLTINGVACGDILTHNASEFVNVSSNQTIGGEKDFTSNQKMKGLIINPNASIYKVMYGGTEGVMCQYGAGTVPESNINPFRFYIGKARNYAGAPIVIDTNMLATGGTNIILRSASNESENALDHRFYVSTSVTDNGDGTKTRNAYVQFYNTNEVKPNKNNYCNLGTASLKWADVNTALLNGLNPGALSLPNLGNEIDISGYIDISQLSEYTAPADGYISISGYASGTNAICIKDKNYNFATASRAVITTSESTTYLIIPVVKNHVYEITCSAVSTLSYAKFYPCQGNV